METGLPDQSLVMVRSRNAKHLAMLKERFDVLEDCEIMKYTGSDYPARIFVHKGVWSCVVSQLAAEISYSNFKSEVSSSKAMRDDRRYRESLHEVWATMACSEPELA